VLLWRNLITVFLTVNTLAHDARATCRRCMPPATLPVVVARAAAGVHRARAHRHAFAKALVLSTPRITRVAVPWAWALNHEHGRACRAAVRRMCTPCARCVRDDDAGGAAMTDLRESARAESARASP